jgi:hypothetical protein
MILIDIHKAQLFTSKDFEDEKTFVAENARYNAINYLHRQGFQRLPLLNIWKKMVLEIGQPCIYVRMNRFEESNGVFYLCKIWQGEEEPKGIEYHPVSRVYEYLQIVENAKNGAS